MLFPGSKFPFWLPPNKFLSFSKVKGKKKKKKKSSTHFHTLSLLPFSIFHLPFTIFLLFFSIFPPFPFFPSLFFPGRSSKIPGQKSCPPPSCYATGIKNDVWMKQAYIMKERKFRTLWDSISRSVDLL